MLWLNQLLLSTVYIMCFIYFSPELSKVVNTSIIGKKVDSILYTNWSKNSNLYKYVVVFLILIGSIVRLWKFGAIPAGFNQDGAMGAVDALALTTYGTDRFGMWLPAHFTAWGFGQMSVLLSYLSIPFIAMFGLNPFTARIPILITSLLSLWVLYALCKHIFGKNAALIVLFFSSINPWQIMQSRWALDCNLLPHFLLFSIYFLTIAFKKERKIYMYISMVFFGLTMYTYGIAWYTIPLFLFIAGLYLLGTKRIMFMELVYCSLTYLFVSWPIFGVMIVNTFSLKTINTPFITIPFFPGTSRKADILFFSENIFEQFKNNFKTTIDIVLLQKPDLPWNVIPEYGTYYLFTLPFLLLGLIYLINYIRIAKSKDFLHVFIIIWLFIALISGLIINGVNVNRINIIFYPIIILCSLGIYALVKKIKVFSIIVLLLYIISFAGFNVSYFGDHSEVIGESFYDGFGEALNFVEDLDYDEIYITNWTQSQDSWWVSEPLTLFHHEVDALYYQGKVDLFSKDGKKLLPYKIRYRYVDFRNFVIDSAAKAVYILNNHELENFQNNMFIIYSFAHYSVAIPTFEKLHSDLSISDYTISLATSKQIVNSCSHSEHRS